MKKILIADAGATKTDWALAEGGEIRVQVKTQGISPFHQDAATIAAILREELHPHLEGEAPDAVYFYGAGCTVDKCGLVADLLRELLGDIEVEVHSDLLGAARALCGHEAGIACILGTGANSCYYDGHVILQNTPPLGYILGDEGSGAVMGKTFVADVLKGLMPDEVVKDFFALAGTTYAEIINRVYRQPLANRYLAQYSRIVFQLRDRAAVHDFLIRHFRLFIRRNIVQYAHPELSLHFVGGIAGAFGEELREAAGLEGYRVGRIEQVPLPGLLLYHQS